MESRSSDAARLAGLVIIAWDGTERRWQLHEQVQVVTRIRYLDTETDGTEPPRPAPAGRIWLDIRLTGYATYGRALAAALEATWEVEDGQAQEQGDREHGQLQARPRPGSGRPEIQARDQAVREASGSGEDQP